MSRSSESPKSEYARSRLWCSSQQLTHVCSLDWRHHIKGVKLSFVDECCRKWGLLFVKTLTISAAAFCRGLILVLTFWPCQLEHATSWCPRVFWLLVGSFVRARYLLRPTLLYSWCIPDVFLMCSWTFLNKGNVLHCAARCLRCLSPLGRREDLMTEAFQGLLPESQLPRGFAATKTTRNSYHVLLHAPTHWQVEAVGGSQRVGRFACAARMGGCDSDPCSNM